LIFFKEDDVLILSRKKDQTIVLTLPSGERIAIMLVEVRGSNGTARIGINAPADVKIWRGEIQKEIDSEK
jgi:carbon storage regulator CsrA